MDRFVPMLCWFGLLLLAGPARAFDTGHHADLTRGALTEFGFGGTAIDVAVVENWLTDYYSSSPTSTIKADVESLHFDNQFGTERLRRYWDRLAFNTRNAAQQAARQSDPLMLLTVLGVSLHAVQDFYTHSNWPETHPPTGAGFRAQTWFDAPPGPGMDIRTGFYPNAEFPNKPPEAREDHGDYGSGLNKDSYVRPRWDQAYVFAHAATRQWISAVRGWVSEVNPAFWTSAQGFTVNAFERAALLLDVNAAFRISEWIAVSGENGHWKGSGSGSLAEFVSFSATWVGSSDSRFVREFKVRRIPRLISDGLSGNTPPTAAPPGVPSIPISQRAVLVRTLSVAEKDDVGLFEAKIDPGGQADFFARITVAGQTFVEAMQLDRRSINPSWTTIRFVPATTGSVPLHYELWDEDGGARGDDDHCDINPVRGRRDLDFNFAMSHVCSSDVQGIHDGPGNAITLQGAKSDSDRAVIRFFVTERSIGP